VSGRRRAALWCVVAAVLGFALWLSWPILTPFLIAVGLAYVLDPLVARIERLGASRTAATAWVMVAFGLVALGVLAVLVPLLVHQIPGLVEAIFEVARQGFDSLQPLIERIARRAGTDAAGLIGQMPGGADIAGQVVAWLGALVAGLASGGLALINLLSLIFLTPVVVFYLLRDWPRILDQIESLLPRDQAATIVMLCREIDARIAGFLRGQALVCLLLGIFYAAGLALVGLRYGIIVGLLSGIVTVVPFVGVLAGAATGIAMAFFQFDNWWQFGAVVFVFALGQFLEGNFVSPKLIGDRVGLHPVWIIVAMLVGGVVGGLIGIILAIPVAAAVAVLMRFAIARYRESPLYLGRSAR